MLRASGLLRSFDVVREHGEFRKLWVGNLVSVCGSGVTRLALPLTAIVVLHAGPVQMGLLVAVAASANLIVGLPAGVIIDRFPRRLIMIGADVGRGLLLATIPLAALLGALTMAQLYVVAFLAAALDFFFDVAATSVLPMVLGRERLIDGNVSLTVNNQAAKIAGPSVAGVLIQVVTAPVALVLDALSFLVSAACVAAVRLSEAPLTRRAVRGGWWSEMLDGIKLVIRDDMLRSILGASVLGALAGAMLQPLELLFFTRELELSPATAGVILATGGITAIPGSLLARAAADRLGQGRAMAAGTFLSSLGVLLIPLAGGPVAAIVALLVVSQLLVGIGIPIWGINQLTVRQSVVPNELQGRANAARRLLTFGAAPLGAIVSGYLAQGIGYRPTMFVGALLLWSALLWTVRSPLWSLRATRSPDVASVAR